MTGRGRLFDGRKYMWDGVEYETEEQAASARDSYAADGFHVEVWLEEGKAYVYTRREVKEAAIEQS